ncbi:MAG: bifunctional diguanylate cyclase/phosphodiesterase [Rhodobacteraceae bacterium]|nr:bifunctional diguanylate cyclase/phosphodiesterase [Paracoccaceae bacterium]
MPSQSDKLMGRMRRRVIPILTGPPVLAFMPALTLGAFWLGGEPALVIVALGLPLFFASTGMFGKWSRDMMTLRDAVSGLLLREGFEQVAGQVFEDTAMNGMKTALIKLELDDFRQLEDRHGQTAADHVIQVVGDRMTKVLRTTDSIARVSDGRFAVCLAPVRNFDMELCLQLTARLQEAIEDPVSLGGTKVYMTCSAGFCLRSRAPDEGTAGWLKAAATALHEAQQNGPSAIRAYSADMHRRVKIRSDLREEVAAALDDGQIAPWFQPQISTETGKVSGFEALARWRHPVRGMVAPDDFIPALTEAGLIVRMGETVLYQSLTALKAWDASGFDVPAVGINFCQEELRDPALVDRIRWELDRFDLKADRLNIEILETVVADSPDDIVTMNIHGLSELGCGIDLDDYGTGHASIGSIRRFPVSRIKIDRSFVMKSDRDPEQQKLVSALLTMAERLGLETLAEGVETVGEHALMAQLGCDHVQGFGIGRPMPFEQTLDWISTHLNKLQDPPRISGQKP